MICKCGRPIRRIFARELGIDLEWIHTDDGDPTICEDGWYDEDADKWHDPLRPEPVRGDTP